VNIVIWGGLVIRGPRYELHLTTFWKCLASADFIKDLIWRVQLLNAHVVFFIFTLIVSVKYLEIMIFACVFHPIFICDLCTLSSILHLCLCLSSMARYITAIVHVRRGLVFCKVTSSKRKTCNYRFQLTGHE
jgi:hypothetical protein